jgi:anti-sigma factor RsiW
VSATAAGCVPISWLRLERYHLGELPPAERDAVAGHLDGCGRCRACLEQIRSLGGADLAALPAGLALATAGGAAAAAMAPVGRRGRGFTRGARSARWGLLGLGGAAAAAAALVLLVARPSEVVVARRQVIQTKGGEVTFELVRERSGSVAWDAAAFAPQDRFKVLLTCPPPLRLYADLAVVQADGAAFPAGPAAISCGNRVAFPVAFRITGPGPAAVCLSVDQVEPPPRDRLPTSCIHLDPAGD